MIDTNRKRSNHSKERDNKMKYNNNNNNNNNNQTNKRVRRNKQVKTVIFAIVTIILFFIVLGRVGYHETHYNREAIVISINSDSVITVKDNTNNVWKFVGDGYTVGDEVQMLMSTEGTESIITDDKIINVKLH